jgi:hypothetical protein
VISIITFWACSCSFAALNKRDLSHERESSEQFVWYGETEMQLCRWAMMPSIQADWSQDEVI